MNQTEPTKLSELIEQLERAVRAEADLANAHTKGYPGLAWQRGDVSESIEYDAAISGIDLPAILACLEVLPEALSEINNSIMQPLAIDMVRRLREAGVEVKR
jgi:hypothetical protein